MEMELTEDFAKSLDEKDTLSHFRERFLMPMINGVEATYFTGNSLGLQPDKAKQYLVQELDDWAQWGVDGHFEAKNPWFSYHEAFSPLLAPIVGAKEKEVVAMGSLTNNLHLLMVSFYRPTASRYKILSEKKAFPSDLYALDSQAKFHGFDPEDAVVEIGPRDGESEIRTEDILDKIEELGDSLATIMMGGVNYYTGQLFDMKSITEKGKEVGAVVGFDLAHAAGNVKLKLHEWNVDFAAWCSYKYLNSGPGSVAGIFVHEQHHNNLDLPRFHGWWGNDPRSRFKMKRKFEPFESAEVWQLSNAPVFSMAVHRASLEIFQEAGMQNLHEKAEQLSAYCYSLINEINKESGRIIIEILTPENPAARGCQLSLVIKEGGKSVFDRLTENNVITDWREPDVIRLAPVPLYNSFTDVYKLYINLKSILLS